VPTICSSTPVIGSGSFYPQGKWFFPRSYVFGVVVQLEGWTTFAVDNVYTSVDNGNPARQLVYVLRPNVFVWSSNYYSLDYIICESRITNFAGDAWHPISYECLYDIDFVGTLPYLTLRTTGFFATHKQYFPLPPAPPDYWLPS